MTKAVPEAGFSLLEVTVALAILGVSMVVILGTFSNTLSGGDRLAGRAIAISHAQSMLARIGTEWPLAAGDSSGFLGEGFRWQANIRPYGTEDDWKSWPAKPYEVKVSISREDIPLFTLETIKLGSKVP